MTLHELVATSNRVAETGGRLEKINQLAGLLRRLDAAEIPCAVSFLTGSTRQGRIGIGPALVWSMRSESANSGPPPAEAPLRLQEVDEAFERVARTSGAGSNSTRASILRDLFHRASNDERDFLARLLVGELRQGALDGVLVEAVARASGVGPALVRRAEMMAGALAPVASAALLEGQPGVERIIARLFQPIKPMLAESAPDVGSALADLGDASLEFKLDGARVQVHKAGQDVRVFSRHLREVTSAVPDVVQIVRAMPAGELILDGEIIALQADGTPRPFQDTMKRFGRKQEVERLRSEMPLTPFFFDCLYREGLVIDEPFHRRRQYLTEVAPAAFVMPHVAGPTSSQADEFLDLALRSGHEGVMAKALGAPYAAGKRATSWLKVKSVRTLDLVVLAAEWGHGRRRGWLSNLHLGARDAQAGGFLMLGKTFKGMTDQMLTWQTAKLLELEVARDAYTVYVRPELVVEVAFNGVQQSPVYPGGVALRFARVKRYRTDKSAPEADTIDEVRRIK